MELGCFDRPGYGLLPGIGQLICHARHWRDMMPFVCQFDQVLRLGVVADEIDSRVWSILEENPAIHAAKGFLGVHDPTLDLRKGEPTQVVPKTGAAGAFRN